MKIFKVSMFLILINFVVFALTACNYTKEENRISFRYASGSKKDYDGYAYYEDDYFSSPSTYYNPSFATCSLCFAMASFASNEGEVSDYSNKAKNSIYFMKQIGFKDIYVNDYYKKKPETDSLGVVIGSKIIGDYTVLALGLRGAGYQQEWASNVTIGDGTDCLQHKGFYDGSTILLNEINKYIIDNNISGKIKIWSTGFSRASVVSNICMARIDKALYQNIKILPDSVSVTKEDIYCYGFEVPRGAFIEEDINPRSEIYSNLFNIVNVNDPVPLVAMSALGFTRYGIDIYLPNPLNDDNYDSTLNRIKDNYNKTSDAKDTGEYIIDKFTFYGGIGEVSKSLSGDEDTVNFLGGLYFAELLKGLIRNGISNRTIFKNTIEDGLREVFSIMHSKDSVSESVFGLAANFVMGVLLNADLDYMMEELERNPEHFVDDLLPFIKAAVINDELVSNPEEFIINISGFLRALVQTFTTDMYLFFPIASPTNLRCIAQAHLPNICLANLMTMDKNYTQNPIEVDMDGGYYIFSAEYDDSVGEVEIYSNNLLVAKIKNGATLRVSNLSYGCLDDKFVCFLPKNKEYRIVTNLTNFSLEEYRQTEINYINKGYRYNIDGNSQIIEFS